MSEEQSIKLYEKLSDIAERVARMETMLREREKENERIILTQKDHERRIKALEDKQSKFFGAKEFAAWLLTTALAVWGLVK